MQVEARGVSPVVSQVGNVRKTSEPSFHEHTRIQTLTDPRISLPFFCEFPSHNILFCCTTTLAIMLSRCAIWWSSLSFDSDRESVVLMRILSKTFNFSISQLFLHHRVKSLGKKFCTEIVRCNKDFIFSPYFFLLCVPQQQVVSRPQPSSWERGGWCHRNKNPNRSSICDADMLVPPSSSPSMINIQ